MTVSPPPTQCPVCGKPIPAYRKQTPYCDCGWRARPPETPHQSSSKPGTAGALLGQLSAQASDLGQRSGLSRLLRQKSFYFFILWGFSPLFALFERESLLVGWGWLAVLPILLSWATLYAAVQNIPFPVQQIPRPVLQVLLFCTPFFQKINVSGASQRPFWTAIALWVTGIMILMGLGFSSLGLAFTALIVILSSFSILLF